MNTKKLLVSIIMLAFLTGYALPVRADTTTPPVTPTVFPLVNPRHPAAPGTLPTPEPDRGTRPNPVGPVEISSAVYSDVSQPVSDLVGLAPVIFDNGAGGNEQLLPILPGRGRVGVGDGALQTSTGPLVGTTSGLNFAGIGDAATDMYAPSDDNGAVGATQYVQWVNASFAVFDKTTGAIAAGFPKLGNSIWSGFGGGCETNNDGDPVVQYDKIHNRWVLTQFSVSSQPYLECIAVSTTSDATGTYNRYAFSYGTQFNDYPKLGIWPDGYYISYNIFTNGTTWAGGKVCALESAKMLVGDTSATQQCFQLSSQGGLLPSDLDGTIPPPSGAPDYFMNFNTTSLNLWKFHVDWSTPAKTTFSGPTSIAVPSFSAACSGGGTCIPQSGTTQQLDSLADRLMYRLAYRNFGDHEALVVNQSVTAGSSVGIRWYEIRSPGASPSIYQSGTFAPDSNYRWMGSIAMDKVGDIALGYSVSSASMFPSIRYTGRVPTDPLGTMEAETTIMNGTGSQTGSLSRWGDYTAMTVDPIDDCTFWYTNQYLKSSGSFNWYTRISSFKFPNCQPQTFSDVPNNYSVVYGGVTYYLHNYIQALYAGGLTNGCNTNPLSYCPDKTLNRAESAKFMLTAMQGTSYTPPTDPSGYVFQDDWSPSSINWGRPWAEGLWDASLTNGCSASPLLFCPAKTLVRTEWATFGLRIKYGGSYTPPAASHIFADDWSSPSVSWAEPWAEKAYLDGLLPACGSSGGKPLFCPTDLVTRDWAAYVIVKAKGLTPIP